MALGYADIDYRQPGLQVYWTRLKTSLNRLTDPIHANTCVSFVVVQLRREFVGAILCDCPSEGRQVGLPLHHMPLNQTASLLGS
jgi:hypothetical protein